MMAAAAGVSLLFPLHVQVRAASSPPSSARRFHRSTAFAVNMMDGLIRLITFPRVSFLHFAHEGHSSDVPISRRRAQSGIRSRIGPAGQRWSKRAEVRYFPSALRDQFPAAGNGDDDLVYPLLPFDGFAVKLIARIALLRHCGVAYELIRYAAGSARFDGHAYRARPRGAAHDNATAVRRASERRDHALDGAMQLEEAQAGELADRLTWSRPESAMQYSQELGPNRSRFDAVNRQIVGPTVISDGESFIEKSPRIGPSSKRPSPGTATTSRLSTITTRRGPWWRRSGTRIAADGQ